jgi:hypothetical protein
LTAQVSALPEKLRAWYADSKNAPVKADELFLLFNAWTRQVGARLNAISPEAYRAFVAGMSVADTFWALQIPGRQTERERAKTAWRRMLSKSRLDEERRRIRTLEGYLPRYVAPVIAKHFEKWSIGTTLADQSGRLVLTPQASGPLTMDEERTLQAALHDQVKRWKRMLFGSWAAVSFLRPRERRKINWLRRGIFALGIMLPIEIFTVLVLWLIAYVLLFIFLPALLGLLTRGGAGVSDWLTLANFAWTVALVIPIPWLLRIVYQSTRGAQQWIDDRLKVHYIAQRTYVAWDKQVKYKSGQSETI